jgi:hypothetical protein
LPRNTWQSQSASALDTETPPKIHIAIFSYCDIAAGTLDHQIATSFHRNVALTCLATTPVIEIYSISSPLSINQYYEKSQLKIQLCFMNNSASVKYQCVTFQFKEEEEEEEEHLLRA